MYIQITNTVIDGTVRIYLRYLVAQSLLKDGTDELTSEKKNMYDNKASIRKSQRKKDLKKDLDFGNGLIDGNLIDH